MKTNKKITAVLLAVLLLMAFSMPLLAAVSLPSITSSRPILCYTLKSSGRIDAYAAADLRTKTGGYIDCSTDECRILKVSGNAVQVKYPVSRGTRTAWFARNEFTNYNISGGAAEKWTQKTQVTTYKRADGKEAYGSISADDTCYKLSESGNYKQVIYPMSGGYKMGWIAKDSGEGSNNSSNSNNSSSQNSSRPVSDGLYKVVSAINRQYVWDIYDASMDNGGNLQLWKDNGTNAQKFKFTYNSDGYYTITNIKSNKAVDCAGAKSADGTNIQQYTSNKTDAQKWKLTDAGSGYYTFMCKSNGKMIDVSGGTASSGKNIQLYRSNGSNAQKFALVQTRKADGDDSGNIVIGGVTLDYALGDYFTDNGKACASCHNGHSGSYATNEKYCNCKCTAKIGNKTYKLGSIQCLGFARYVQSALYGTNSYLSSKSFGKTGSVSASKLTAGKVKSMITSAGVGAHIRTGTENEHSMIVAEVTKDGFTVIQCNGSNNDNYKSYAKCRIGTTKYTWYSYKNSTYGRRGIKFIETYKN